MQLASRCVTHALSSVVLVLGVGCSSTSASTTRATTLWTKELQQSMRPDDAIERLRAGHARFRAREHVPFDYAAQVEASSHGQYPFASVLSCIDSRAPVEPIFDVGIGEVFSVRVAGVVIDEDVLGSLEYTVKFAGSKAIVVMGHTSCGAVKGAIDKVSDGHVGALVGKLAAAVAATHVEGEHSSHNHELVDAVARTQVISAISEMKARSEIIRGLADAGAIRIVGALYHVESGTVEFIDVP